MQGLRLGTRGSPLALAQARKVAAAIETAQRWPEGWVKIVESIRPEGIHIAAVRPRGDVRDRIVGAESIDALREGAVVGTSSPRRKAQLLRLRPDLKIVPIRGNVETRLRKVEDGEFDATL